MKIPKVLHFIWAGGVRKLPREYAENVNLWSIQNPDFAINLWIDRRSDPTADAFYAREIRAGRLPATLRLMDIEEQDVCTEYVRYEIDRLKPNYGKSSDQLRYRILQKFGGAYFDSDIIPGETRLNEHEAFTTEWAEHQCLYVDPDSQGSGVIGNDGFISTQDNPIMNYLSTFCEHSYYDLVNARPLIYEPENEQFASKCMATNNRSALYAYDDAQYLFHSTIDSTGPGAVRSVIGSEIPASGEQRLGSYIRVMINTTSPMPEKPMGKWRGVPIKNYDQLEDAIAAVERTITFEVNHMRIFRFSDHINNLRDATKTLYPPPSDNTIITALDTILQKINPKKVERVQLMPHHFYYIHQLTDAERWLDKIGLFPFVAFAAATPVMMAFYQASSPEWRGIIFDALSPKNQQLIHNTVDFISLTLNRGLIEKLSTDPALFDEKFQYINQLNDLIHNYSEIKYMPGPLSRKVAEIKTIIDHQTQTMVEAKTRVDVAARRQRIAELRAENAAANESTSEEENDAVAPRSLWSCCK